MAFYDLVSKGFKISYPVCVVLMLFLIFWLKTGRENIVVQTLREMLPVLDKNTLNQIEEVHKIQNFSQLGFN